MHLPPENQRLKKVIDFYCQGNELLFSNEIAVSQPRINRLFNVDSRSGKFPIVSFDIVQSVINKFVDVNAEWLITGRGKMLKDETDSLVNEQALRYGQGKLRGVPLIPWDAFAGSGLEMLEGIDAAKIEDRYEVPLFQGLQVDFMIPVKGSSMYPKYNSGDVVACRLIKELIFVQWNKTYVLDTLSQGIVLKRLKKSDNDGRIICKSDNKDYEDFEVPLSEIRSIALVVGVIRLE